MNSSSLLAVPAFEKGCGGGHLVRSLALVCSLRSQNRETYLYTGGQPLLPTQDVDPSWLIPDEKTLKSRPWDFIVLDRFKTPPEEFARWSALAPLIGIDEGGSMRDSFDFLIDLLPGLPEISSPNILAPHLLPLPKNRRDSFYLDPQDRPLRILVSFGAEDPGNLTIPACRALALPETVEITALFGGFNRLVEPVQPIAGVQFREHILELREHLAEYDLVITHFGLTAFECIHARVPVLLVSPGAYHEKLARRAGFTSAGIGAAGTSALRGLLYKHSAIHKEFLKTLSAGCAGIGNRYGLEDAPALPGLGDLLGSYIPHVPQACPSCGSPDRFKHPVIARFPDRTYRRCFHCGMVYMLRPVPPPIAYERDYFFAFYKKQYGKTYLEDFPNLIKTGKARLQHIKALLPSAQARVPRLLDIGCAYGPFLAAAQEVGFSPTGIDPAEDAVRYVQEELKIPAFRGFFPDTPLPDVLQDETFEVISLWYVIEHFENPGSVLREIHRLLKPGGILAFSTPSFSGVSGRVSAQGFLTKSPADHWTIWDPRYTGKALKTWGFTLKKIVVSGHHPERFPLVGKGLTQKRSFLYGLCLWISRLFRLGDTFEAYAIKK